MKMPHEKNSWYSLAPEASQVHDIKRLRHFPPSPSDGNMFPFVFMIDKSVKLVRNGIFRGTMIK